MRKFILAFALLLLAGIATAQTPERDVRRFEFEPSIGWNGFIAIALEGRYNFRKPWDVGVKASMDYGGSQVCVVGDYNIARNKELSLFCGMGLGVAGVDILDERDLPDPCLRESQACFYAMPRVGIELARHLRITAALNTYNMRKANLVLSAGIAFGGGKKKNR